jgi:hypothetical protein
MLGFKFCSCAYIRSRGVYIRITDARLEITVFLVGSYMYIGSGDACLDMTLFQFGVFF